MVVRKLEKYLTRQFEQHVSRDSIATISRASNKR